jgi:hypothetical protein
MDLHSRDDDIQANINPELGVTTAGDVHALTASADDAEAVERQQQIAETVMRLQQAQHQQAQAHLANSQYGVGVGVGVGAQLSQSSAPGTPGAQITPGAKVRTKVSRACDECRRKKVSNVLHTDEMSYLFDQIRCDASNDSDTSSCSGCKKASIECKFSRTPQKRGPSKG